MSGITLRVVDGSDRGKVFDGLQPVITIGREEGNTIQLNDERVSRFHLKIQRDKDHLVLTDLESTNGTRVNGEDVQLRVLRFGDTITVGRSVLLFGSREQIAGRLAQLRQRAGQEDEADLLTQLDQIQSLDFELNWPDDQLQTVIHTLEPPRVPEGLSPTQAAQLGELVEYLHVRLRKLVDSVEMRSKSPTVELNIRQWQNLLDVQARLAEYFRRIGDPGDE